MSILHYSMNGEPSPTCKEKENERYNRDMYKDLKNGLDLIFQLKNQLDKMHPIATEALIRLLSP